MKTIKISATTVRTSSNSPPEERERNGAVDVDIAIEIYHADGKRELPCSDGEVTLYRDDANGGYSTRGTPRDWCSSKLFAAIDKMGTDRDVREILEKLAGIAAEQAEHPNRNGSTGAVELE